nr:uncharacterized protein CTRU02_04654 [Colletotrichum truncatum]KAF6795091.1 hypothetical protein CTRU02_04654 [Colletotrichum truncatum]
MIRCTCAPVVSVNWLHHATQCIRIPSLYERFTPQRTSPHIFRVLSADKETITTLARDSTLPHVLLSFWTYLALSLAQAQAQAQAQVSSHSYLASCPAPASQCKVRATRSSLLHPAHRLELPYILHRSASTQAAPIFLLPPFSSPQSFLSQVSAVLGGGGALRFPPDKSTITSHSPPS